MTTRILPLSLIVITLILATSSYSEPLPSTPSSNTSGLKKGLIPVDFKSGYVPIDTASLKTAKDKTYYVYFPAESNSSTAPLLVYLSGAANPGCNSEFAISIKNGPFYFDRDQLGRPVVMKK